MEIGFIIAFVIFGILMCLMLSWLWTISAQIQAMAHQIRYLENITKDILEKE